MQKTGNQAVKATTRISITGNWNNGYTLIELGVVVFLMGLLLSLSVPRIRDSLLFNDEKSVIRDIVGKINGLREQAARTRTGYILRFDLVQNEYWIESYDMTAEGRWAARENAKRLPGNVKVTDISHPYTRIKKLGTEDAMYFDASVFFTAEGYVEPTIIYLRADDNETWTIALSPFLSKTKVFDHYVDAAEI
jgi:type II secretory pathway pseudopilin PulG